jgi:anaerobic magnesium-protoporphyrin IX monomethyl ester cyclase
VNRRKVLLYNPRAVFWTMPLSLIAVGSALDPSLYSVVLVDGRLEDDPVGALLKQCDRDTVCLGITVLTGSPIRDALAVSRAVKKHRPQLPVIWGGWHPSLFPQQCLSEPSVDAVVIGQGELTFQEIVDRLAAGKTWDDVSGCAFRSGPGTPSLSPPRLFQDVNGLPEHNYGLVAVDAYFRRKGRRQFDYVSSQGCRFRCSFCADPKVFMRGWYGLEPERIARELAANHQAHRFNEVAFQDETFFTSSPRVGAIAEELLKNNLSIDWTATMRPDQGSRLDDALFALCKRSGLRRVMMGIESGSAQTLERIQKDITVDQVFDSAAKCLRHGIGAILNFIVGFPEESDEEIQETLKVAAELSALSPDFEIAVFYFRPYPGTRLADGLLSRGHSLGETLEAWAEFDYIAGRESWITQQQWQRIERFKFYQRQAFGRKRHLLRRPLQLLSRWRVNNGFYSYPFEKIIVERFKSSQPLS